jgi:hypothetical protein
MLSIFSKLKVGFTLKLTLKIYAFKTAAYIAKRHARIPKEEPYNKANIRQSFPVKRVVPPMSAGGGMEIAPRLSRFRSRVRV